MNTYSGPALSYVDGAAQAPYEVVAADPGRALAALLEQAQKDAAPALVGQRAVRTITTVRIVVTTEVQTP